MNQSATAAEARANELIKSIRKAYATERNTTDPSVRAAAIRMFDNVACTRDGTTLVLSWPLDAELAQR